MAEKNNKSSRTSSEELKGVESCPVHFKVPPKVVPFGSLGFDPDGRPIQMGRPQTRRSSLVYPKNAKPKGIQFPFLSPDEDADRILHADVHLHHGPGNIMGKIRVGRQKLIFPGWLIELNETQLNGIMVIKSILGIGRKICEMKTDLTSEVQKLVPSVPEQDVIEVVRRIPLGEKGWSFPHFMLGIGCPKLARAEGVFQSPIPFKSDECNNSGGDGTNKPDKQEQKALSRAEAIQRLVEPYKYEKPDSWPLSEEQMRVMDEKRASDEEHGIRRHKKVSEELDATGYTIREKLFFSGLLIFEMYHTIRLVENLYFQSDSIPLPREKIRQNQNRRGFGVENIGFKKFGFAEWDRPLPPIPTISPYLQTLPFVATRWKITRPNEIERVRRRTLTVLQPLHLVVNPPPVSKLAHGKIQVTENQERIKQAIAYLASTGNCVAKLPYAHCIVHLSDTFLEKLEEINIHAMDGDKLPPPLKPNNDMAMIRRDAKHLLMVYKLPPQIARMKDFVTIGCAICLRKICGQLRDEHWEIVSKKAVEFRNKAWRYMHVERIPCGLLREHFVYAFDTYLPFKSYLPIVHDNLRLPRTARYCKRASIPQDNLVQCPVCMC